MHPQIFHRITSSAHTRVHIGADCRLSCSTYSLPRKWALLFIAVNHHINNVPLSLDLKYTFKRFVIQMLGPIQPQHLTCKLSLLSLSHSYFICLDFFLDLPSCVLYLFFFNSGLMLSHSTDSIQKIASFTLWVISGLSAWLRTNAAPTATECKPVMATIMLFRSSCRSNIFALLNIEWGLRECFCLWVSSTNLWKWEELKTKKVPKPIRWQKTWAFIKYCPLKLAWWMTLSQGAILIFSPGKLRSQKIYPSRRVVLWRF